MIASFGLRNLGVARFSMLLLWRGGGCEVVGNYFGGGGYGNASSGREGEFVILEEKFNIG